MNWLLVSALALFAFAVSCGLILSTIAPMRRLGLLDWPGGRKRHCCPVPLCGGVAIFFSFAFALLLSRPGSKEEWLGLVLGSAGAFSLGLYDDLKSSSAGLRLLTLVSLIGVAMIWLGGLQLTSLGDLLGAGSIQLSGFAIPFTIISVVGLINAINMIDGLDGLAGGVSAIALAGFCLLALAVGDFGAAVVTGVLLASVAGFLVFNFPLRRHSKAMVFMGDSGSIVLGFALGWIAVDLAQDPSKGIAPITAVWLLGLPIADTVRVMVRRMAQGRSPFAPGRDHLHHLLLDFGFAPRVTLAVLLLVSGLFASVAVMAELGEVSEATMFGVAMAVFIVLCAAAEVLTKFKLQVGSVSS